MIDFPLDTVLGDLDELETYVEFNGAQLFSCQNQRGQIFFSLWSEEEEDYNSWLYVPISVSKLRNIRAGNEDVQNLFINPEFGLIYRVIYSHNKDKFEATPITPRDLNSDWLPSKDTFLECSVDTFPSIRPPNRIMSSYVDLGELEIQEVYVEYNGEQLFTCQNTSLQLFLVLWIEEEFHYNSWLYLLISSDKLQKVRRGEIDIRDAFCNSETKVLYQVTFSYIDYIYSIETITSELIKEEWLPLEDTYLRCEEDPSLFLKYKTVSNAIKMNREVANISFHMPSEYPHEASISKLGKTLVSFQDMINCLTIPTGNKTSSQKKAEAKKAVEFNIFNSVAGSFEVELASVIFDRDIYGNSIAGDAMQHIICLLEIGDDTNRLKDYIYKLPKTTAKWYLKFIKTLADTGGEVSIKWGSPTPNRGGEKSLSLRHAKEIIRQVEIIDKQEPEEKKVIGILFKHDNMSWKFGIQEISSGYKYRGDVVGQAKNINQLTTGEAYVATIREIKELNLGQDEKVIYQLIDIEYYEDD